MKAPTQQQLNDPKWWDENAPEGATHSSAKTGAWFQIINGSVWEWIDDGWMPKELIPRPAKPEPKERGVVEAELHEGEGAWYEAVIVGKTLDGQKSIIEWVDEATQKHSVDALPDSRIRPLRTQAEREREETVDEALGYLEYRTRNLDAEDEMMKGRLTALYNAGMLRKVDQ